MSHPIEGNALVLAAARASVGPSRLPELLAEAQATLAGRRDAYRRGYERALDGDAAEAFFVEQGHWAGLGDEFGWNRREHEAAARAHRAHLLQAGRREGRRDEFESALELREVVVVGR
ncbi:hypothetical protein [Halosegnis marinus]|uniref:DUF8048 domain-containing protein n=1 Tax=Halosegnis marinus TaxID=3034023 RepID=A0ABD5ZQN0_9EURY|nr:hypothetical protein [Halosegnis sp. DT85]